MNTSMIIITPPPTTIMRRWKRKTTISPAGKERPWKLRMIPTLVHSVGAGRLNPRWMPPLLRPKTFQPCIPVTDPTMITTRPPMQRYKDQISSLRGIMPVLLTALPKPFSLPNLPHCSLPIVLTVSSNCLDTMPPYVIATKHSNVIPTLRKHCAYGENAN